MSSTQPRRPVEYASLFDQYVAQDERGVLEIDSDRVVVAANPAARGLLDYHAALPAPISEVAHDMHVNFAVGDVIHDRRSATLESYAPAPDRLLRYTMYPILTQVGEVREVVAVIEDVTRLRHLETVRRDFVANVSHELRTPLASMRLLVETLQGGALADPVAAEHFLHRIEVEVDAMAALVEELLELSRLESGVLTLNLSEVSPVRLLEDVANRLAPAAEEKGISLRIEAGTLPPVTADQRRAEQVLMNLTHNAIKFTPEGGEVALRAGRKGLGVQFEVADNGPGMSRGEAARIFERFYKLDQGRKRDGGAGLGLAIARHLVELHGGRLQAVSSVGNGARFTFTLPAAV